MRIVLINQYYPQDTAPTGVYLHDLARMLVARGHSVRVYCSQDSYGSEKTFFPDSEYLDGVFVYRLPGTGLNHIPFLGKLAGYCSFFVSLGRILLNSDFRPDIIVSLTTPPFAGLLGALFSRILNCVHVNWIMDLYPDALLAAGFAQEHSFRYRILKFLARWHMQNSVFNIVLGSAMSLRVQKYVDEKSVVEVPLWSSMSRVQDLSTSEMPLRARRNWIGKCVFMYSGNMGRGHEIEQFLKAASIMKKSGPHWVFCGGGTGLKIVEKFIAENPGVPCEILPSVSPGELCAHLSSADVHLASIRSGWDGIIVPSKTQNIFATGKPLLFVGSDKSETAQWIRESNGGWIVRENDLDALVATAKAAMCKESQFARGLAAANFAAKSFDIDRNCTQICELLESTQKKY